MEEDRLSGTVWLTRGDTQGLFNAYYQGSYEPEGTYWRWGADDAYFDYEYTSWQNAVEQSGYNVSQALGQQLAGPPVLSVYLWETDEYYDITFLSFTGGNNGGDFAWDRVKVVSEDSDNDLSWLGVQIQGPGTMGGEINFTNDPNYWNQPWAQDRITDGLVN